MRRIAFLRAALCLFALVTLFSLTVAPTEASAQCNPCPTWWVNYDYIWPPCDTANAVTVDVGWGNGQISTVTSNVDGHITYNTPNPISPALWVSVNGIHIPMGGKVKIPYNCGPLFNMCLEVEVRCNPCLEVKVKLVPC